LITGLLYIDISLIIAILLTLGVFGAMAFRKPREIIIKIFLTDEGYIEFTESKDLQINDLENVLLLLSSVALAIVIVMLVALIIGCLWPISVLSVIMSALVLKSEQRHVMRNRLLDVNIP
jgi:hypothetical protein